MTILVLGPSKWRRGYTPSEPPSVEILGPADWLGPRTEVPSPLAIRAAMVAFLREVEGVRATLMEMHQPEPGERHTALFARVCREAKVNGYFIYWPYGAQRSGLDVELGFLLWQLEHGKSLDIRLFVESGPKSAGRVEDGQFVARELGRRTRYYEDLVAYGVDLVEWASYSELWEAIYHHAHSWLNET